MNPRAHTALRIISIVLLVITGLNALAAGFSFITEPSGKGTGASTEILKYSPFLDFTIPGILLFTVIGLGSCTAAIAAIRKWKYYSWFIAIEGGFLTGWITIQMMLLRQINLLQIIFFVTGIFFIVSGLKLRRLEQGFTLTKQRI